MALRGELIDATGDVRALRGVARIIPALHEVVVLLQNAVDGLENRILQKTGSSRVESDVRHALWPQEE